MRWKPWAPNTQAAPLGAAPRSASEFGVLILIKRIFRGGRAPDYHSSPLHGKGWRVQGRQSSDIVREKRRKSP